jgi:acyl-CoA thioester hydrolase
MTSRPPAGFRHRLPMDIRFADMDAMGHVNHATFLTYIESARIDYMLQVCQLESPLELGVILAKLTVEYKLPLVLGDEIEVYTRCIRLGNRSFDLEAIILRLNANGEDVAASAVTVMVAYDYATQQTIPVPETWRERITTYEGPDSLTPNPV